MATAVLIHGYIGAGKTTLARRIERERPAVRFSSDEWVAQLYGAGEGAVSDFGAALSRVEPVWTACLRMGVDVVLDLGFWARAKRDRVRAAVGSAGAEVELIGVSTDPQTAWSRVERRNSGLDGSVEIGRAAFDELRADEPHTVLHT